MSISDHISIYDTNIRQIKKDKNSVYRLRFSRSLNTCVTVSQLNTVQNRYDDVLQSRSLFILFSISYDTHYLVKTILDCLDSMRLRSIDLVVTNFDDSHLL